MYAEIINSIKSTIIDCEKSNELGKMWEDPIVGIISADDEKLRTLKEAVSINHFMPRDILPDAKSVISFFIPFHKDVVESNIEGAMASREWAIAYVKTNDLIAAISDKIEKLMSEKGYKTGKIPATRNFDEKKLISDWSHRHIAYIAGIGTFGVNNMLITKKGCCGRFGSIVTNYEFKEYPQKNEGKEKCLNKLHGTCGICRKRCVGNAYPNKSFDRNLCHKQCLENAKYHRDIGHTDVCGKCLVGLPCSLKAP
jgi:epoxyqueuosine reductase QueG